MTHHTNQIVEFNGIKFKVLDIEKLDFSNAVYGIKSAITKVKKAQGGEKIETKNKQGKIESVAVAEFGDAIFCNSETDVYIPHTSTGQAWKFDQIETYGYNIIQKEQDCVFVQSNNKALLLVGIITQPTCIVDAWGKGSHQYLYPGATLKKDLSTGKITGIDKFAFESTWQVFESETSMEI